MPLKIFATLLSLAGADGFLYNGVTAHRGLSGFYPENSLQAVRQALRLNVDRVEVDVYKVQDGSLILMHDPNTGRVADRDWKVEDLTYPQLKRLDIAYQFRRKAGGSRELVPPARIPKLGEVLDLIKQQRKSKISIQPKNDCVEEIIAMVRAKNMLEWVTFNEGNLDLMAKVKKLEPGIWVNWDRPGDSDIDKDIQIAKQHNFQGLTVHHKGMTRAKVQAIKEAGLEPGVWIVNDAKRMRELLELNVFRFYTDFPARLLRLKRAK